MPTRESLGLIQKDGGIAVLDPHIRNCIIFRRSTKTNPKAHFRHLNQPDPRSGPSSGKKLTTLILTRWCRIMSSDGPTVTLHLLLPSLSN